MVADSVERTARLLVVHEDVLRSGFGAEIVAWAADQTFWDLDAPSAGSAPGVPRRLRAELERAILPQAEDIAAAARQLLAA